MEASTTSWAFASFPSHSLLTRDRSPWALAREAVAESTWAWALARSPVVGPALSAFKASRVFSTESLAFVTAVSAWASSWAGSVNNPARASRAFWSESLAFVTAVSP